MSKTIQRLLMFSIGLPSVFAVVFFLPHSHHLAANIVTIIASALGAIEFADMLSRKGYSLPKWEAAMFGALLPLASTIRVSFRISGDWEFIAAVAASLWIVSSRVLAPHRVLETVIERVASAFSVLMYPGAFLVWIVRINSDPNATLLLLLFFLMVFGNDSAAWTLGMTLGKGNRGFIPASPNKSIAGFIGGLATSIVMGIIAAVLFPNILVPRFFTASFSGALVGLFCGLAGIVGDLAESTIKRSADMKDSGFIIPGRGGIMDSIDSIAFAAPIYLAAYTLLFRV